MGKASPALHWSISIQPRLRTWARCPVSARLAGEAIIKGRPYKGKDDLLNRHILSPNVYNGIKSKIIAKQG